MANNNLWIVNSFDDLLYWIKQSKDKCVFLAVAVPVAVSVPVVNTTQVHNSSNLSNQKIIKKYIKETSKNYKNSYFLYWNAREDELTKMSVLPTDVSKYPYVVCISNMIDMLCEVNNVEDVKTLDLCFNQVKKFFDADNNKNLIIETETNSSINSTLPVNVNVSVSSSNSNINPNQIIKVKTAQDIINDKKRHADKVLLIKKKFDNYQIDFFKDIQKRKKDEEKHKNNKTN